MGGERDREKERCEAGAGPVGGRSANFERRK